MAGMEEKTPLRSASGRSGSNDCGSTRPTTTPSTATNIQRTPSSASSTERFLPGSSTKDRAPLGPSTTVAHRSSFAENLRGHPTSPRQAHRSPSLSQQQFMDLIANPPTAARHGDADSKFRGRDWRTVTVGDIVDLELVRFVELDTSVEEATNLLISSGSPNVVLLRENKEARKAVGTFDYNDLNAYLLLVVGLAQPEDRQSFNELAQKGREGKAIPLKDVKDLSRKEPLISLPESADLAKAIEVLGSGIHRIVVVDANGETVGVLTQLRMVEFFWENGRHFAPIEPLYSATLRELDIGAHNVYVTHGDKPLTDALELMNNEGITSLPVLDNSNNVIGNISHVDVKLLTKNTALPLLRSSCIHFISVILSERGMFDGKDSYPVFHVTPQSTIAHTVAKLVATRSHRMWVVQPPSPGNSAPPTPALSASTPNLNVSISPSTVLPPATAVAGLAHTNHPPITSATSLTSSAMSSSSLSGRLSGVVSLTDILNLFAKASGLNPHDPGELRQLRRRSSSASNSLSARRSVESSRSESVTSLNGGSRRGSVSGRRPTVGG